MTETLTQFSLLEALVLKGIVGSVGARKDEVTENFNNLFGQNNWQMGHYADRILPPQEIYNLIDASYDALLQRRRDLVETLQSYADVFDLDPTDVGSKLNYDAQTNPKGKHLQDIAIRRAMQKIGATFKGTKLLQVRSNDRVGQSFSPGRVAFSHPELIPDSAKEDWYDAKSVEAFYQRTKALFVNPESLSVTLNGLSESGFFVRQGEIEYFVDFEDPFVLTTNTKPKIRRDILDYEPKDYFDLAQVALRLQDMSLTPSSDLTPIQYAELEREVIEKPVQFQLDVDAILKNDPLRIGKIHKPLGYGVSVTSRGTYIGIVGEMFHQAIRESAETPKEQQIPGHELFTRLLVYSRGSINEIANFDKETYQYNINLSGKVPSDIFGKLLMTDRLLKKIISTTWKEQKQRVKNPHSQLTYVSERPEDVFALTYSVQRDGTECVDFSANIMDQLHHKTLSKEAGYNAR